jgi:4-hydroxy-tetrahydrodipicolinate synthase
MPAPESFRTRPTRAEALSGVWTAIVTPFRNQEVDYAALRQQVEFQVRAGVTGVCPVGTTGESPTLSHEEHERVISEVVVACAGRIKVMAGTGSNSTAEALRLTRWAARAGCDAALVVGPYYNKPTQEGFYAHYRALAEAVDILLCIYNIPGRTAKQIDADTIIRLAELKGIAMVKEATGQMDVASQIACATDLTILSGDDSMTLPLLSIGGRGVISVVSNIVPAAMIDLVRAFDSGNLARAQSCHHQLFPLCRDMLGLSTNPIPIKGAMKLLGRDTGELRLPMTPLTEKQEEQLRKTLRAFGLPVSAE